MMAIQRAKKSDKDEIIEILTEQELLYPSIKFDDFWIARASDTISSVARVEEFENFCFISSVGTRDNFKNRGTASKWHSIIHQDT